MAINPPILALVPQKESGDLIVLPKEIGHATINVEASIGFAFEMTYYGYDPIRFTVCFHRWLTSVQSFETNTTHFRF